MRTSLCLPYPRPPSGSKEAAPLGESGSAAGLEFLSIVEGAFLIEMVVNGGMNGDEFLQRSHPSETKHRALAPSKWLMIVFGAIVRPAAGFLALSVANFLHRRTEGSQLVGHQYMRAAVPIH